MIDFTCLCGHPICVEDDQAGTSLQCTKCARLVSVPTLDDLKNLDADGTYTFGERYQAPPAPEAHLRVASNAAIQGAAGDIPMAKMISAPARFAPRYDPETGELVRAVELQVHEVSEAQKAAPRTQPVSKSSKRQMVNAANLSPVEVLGQMLRPSSLFVILLIGALHIIVVAWTIMLAGGLAFVSVFGLLFLSPILSQYSLIIQEIGPSQKDELPTPLRDFQFQEDIWQPAVHLLISLAVCFGPLILWHFNNPSGTFNEQVSIALALVGTFFFPVVLMTASIDGIIANFRPDRMLGVMATAKLQYAIAVLTFAVGMLVYLDGMTGQLAWAVGLFHHRSAGAMEARAFYIPNQWIGFGMTLLGLYLLYFCCWQMGLIWRVHHDKFPWIAQRFEKELPAAPMKNSSTPR